MENENRNFIIGTLIALAATAIVSLSPIWQLIIIAGIVAGIFNKTMKRGILSGAVGIATFWFIYMVQGILTKNSFLLLDQFGAILIGPGFGWLIFLIILLMGFLFGALGGAIGSGVMILIRPYLNKYLSINLKSKQLAESE